MIGRYSLIDRTTSRYVRLVHDIIDCVTTIDVEKYVQYTMRVT